MVQVNPGAANTGLDNQPLEKVSMRSTRLMFLKMRIPHKLRQLQIRPAKLLKKDLYHEQLKNA